MNLQSFYEVDCYRCGEKIRTLSRNTICEKCGLEIHLESWQIQYSMTPDELLIKNAETKRS